MNFVALAFAFAFLPTLAFGASIAVVEPSVRRIAFAPEPLWVGPPPTFAIIGYEWRILHTGPGDLFYSTTRRSEAPRWAEWVGPRANVVVTVRAVGAAAGEASALAPSLSVVRPPIPVPEPTGIASTLLGIALVASFGRIGPVGRGRKRTGLRGDPRRPVGALGATR